MPINSNNLKLLFDLNVLSSLTSFKCPIRVIHSASSPEPRHSLTPPTSTTSTHYDPLSLLVQHILEFYSIKMTTEPPYKEIARRKRAQRDALIPPEWRLKSLPSPTTTNFLSIPQTCGILTSRELQITSNYDAVALSQALLARKFTAVEVTTAFCKRAAVAQQLTNCLTEIFFNDAIERAKYLDAEFSKNGKPVGPFHGLPISLKDSFKVTGYDSTIGISALAFKPATSNSLLVDILLEAGAVIYCKTATPQMMLALDTDNNVFGRTLNPLNTKLTSGGSSGGESPLIALRGSILGVGTDVGGSIRIPAMCCGLYGIKPSFQRVPYVGQEGGADREAEREIGTPASAGPIATSIRDCEFFLKVVSEAKPWEKDPSLVFGNWECQGMIGGKPLFGVLRTDAQTTPLPPVAKVLQESVDKLRKAGYEVVEISAPELSKAHQVFNAFGGIDGGNSYFDALEKTSEPAAAWLAPRMKRKPRFNLQDLLNVQKRKVDLQTKMLEVWKDERGRVIDAIICPVAPHPVPQIDKWNGLSYTAGWVVMDYPCGSLPVGKVTADDLDIEIAENGSGHILDKLNRGLCK